MFSKTNRLLIRSIFPLTRLGSANRMLKKSASALKRATGKPREKGATGKP